MLITEEKDEVQLKKARIKTSAMMCVIPELIHMNNELKLQDRKPYTISLDYIPFTGYYRFIVDIRKENAYDNKEPLINIHFCLRNLEAGLLLLDEIRDCYIENNDLTYTSFTMDINNNTVKSFNAFGINQINLKYKIHSENEHKKLVTYEDELCKNPKITFKNKKNN